MRAAIFGSSSTTSTRIGRIVRAGAGPVEGHGPCLWNFSSGPYGRRRPVSSRIASHRHQHGVPSPMIQRVALFAASLVAALVLAAGLALAGLGPGRATRPRPSRTLAPAATDAPPADRPGRHRLRRPEGQARSTSAITRTVRVELAAKRRARARGRGGRLMTEPRPTRAPVPPRPSPATPAPSTAPRAATLRPDPADAARPDPGPCACWSRSPASPPPRPSTTAMLPSVTPVTDAAAPGPRWSPTSQRRRGPCPVGPPRHPLRRAEAGPDGAAARARPRPADADARVVKVVTRTASRGSRDGRDRRRPLDRRRERPMMGGRVSVHLRDDRRSAPPREPPRSGPRPDRGLGAAGSPGSTQPRSSCASTRRAPPPCASARR